MMNGENICTNKKGEQRMDKNFDLYCAASLMTEASKFLRDHDRDFGLVLLEKCQEYRGQIKVDEKLIGEVMEYGKQLQEKIKRENQSTEMSGESPKE